MKDGTPTEALPPLRAFARAAAAQTEGHFSLDEPFNAHDRK